MSRIYVASSWRNEFQPAVVKLLCQIGHEVYDFRNPPNGQPGFSWSEIDPNWKDWDTNDYRGALKHEAALRGFNNDFTGMRWADTCLMILPCGRSANTEAGWMKGAGKKVYVYSPVVQEPELMYKLHDGIFKDEAELIDHFKTNIVAHYPKMEVGNKTVYIKYPVLTKRNNWVCANVLLPEGFSTNVAMTEYEAFDDAQEACNAHNDFYGFTRDFVDEIISLSMENSIKTINKS